MQPRALVSVNVADFDLCVRVRPLHTQEKRGQTYI